MQDNNIIQNAINCIKRLHKENVELKAENERLKQEWRLDCLKCEYKNTKADVDKLRQTLQEIKEIAKIGMHCEGMGCDFMPKILDLITKTESEG